MANRRKIVILFIIFSTLMLLYIFLGINSKNFNYIFPKRIIKILALILVSLNIAIATVIFQALTNNHILTPSMLGFDSLYMLTQTTFVFVFSANSILISNQHINFFVSLFLMVLFSILLYGILFKKIGNQLFAMLLIGMIFSTFFRSFTSFFQMLIDPNEFSIIQDKSFASFNNMNIDIFWFAFIVSLVIIILISDEFFKIDVIALGKDEAINLGIDYDKHAIKYLIIISILIAIATALVGPVMFLGLLVVNIARNLSSTYKHTSLICLSFLICIIFLIAGQLLLERVFNFAFPLSIIINFVGGIYMLYLLKKEMKI